MNLPCPRCHSQLAVVGLGDVQVDHCYGCGGTLLEAGEAAEAIGVHAEPTTWRESGASFFMGPTQMRCPRDGEHLHAYRVHDTSRAVDVDVCPRCDALWLDRDECARLRHIVVVASQDREAFTRGQESNRTTVKGYVFRLLTAMPGEVWNPTYRRPVINILLLVLLALAYAGQVWAVGEVSEDPRALGGWKPFDGLWLVPEELYSASNLQAILAYIFLHAGLLHLLANAYFLFLFGDNVEDYLGRARYLALFLASGVAGGIAHAALPGDASMPLVGASGAIAGVMGAYVMCFRGIRLRVVWVLIPLRVRVELFMGLWVLIQLALMITETASVSWQAHLGGFVTGLVLARAWRKQPVTGLLAS
jgi:membrane associated rhomboid family serine protease